MVVSVGGVTLLTVQRFAKVQKIGEKRESVFEIWQWFSHFLSHNAKVAHISVI
jgi:hypothetical protein